MLPVKCECLYNPSFYIDDVCNKLMKCNVRCMDMEQMHLPSILGYKFNNVFKLPLMSLSTEKI